MCVSFKHSFNCAIRRADLRAVCWHHELELERYSPPDFQYVGTNHAHHNNHPHTDECWHIVPIRFVAIACAGPELVGVLHDGSIATTTGLFPGSASGYDEPVWDAWRSSSTSTSPTKGVVAADRTTTCMIVGNEYTSIHMTPNSGTVRLVVLFP